MSLKKFTNITPAELKSKGVVSLADKPNTAASYGVGGLSPTALKLWFDQLSKLLADKINGIQNTLSSDNAAEYIKLILTGLDSTNETEEYSLQDLCDAFKNGNFAEYLQAYGSAAAENLSSLQTILNSFAVDISEAKELGQEAAESAEESATDAADSATAAGNSAQQAADSADLAEEYAEAAAQSASAALQSETNAEQSAEEAADWAELARQYAELGIQPNTDYDSVSELPEQGSTKFIYLIPSSGGTETNNVYDEYIWVTSKGKYEKIGSTKIDLSQYASKAEVAAKYTKPSGGIPETDLSQAVQDKLNEDTGGDITKNSLIERADSLPATVDDDTADIWAIDEGDECKFYLKKTPTPALTATPPVLSFSTGQGSGWSNQSGSVTMSGGDGDTYSFSTSRGNLPTGINLNITPSGNTCSVSITSNYYDNDGTWSATLICTCGTQTLEIPINLEVYVCLTGDTLITMSNGKKKRIDEMQIGDRVLSFNPRNGLLETDVVYAADSQVVKTHDHYDRYEFDDGTVIKVVHRHRFYNVDKQAMIHLDSWEIGDRAFKQNGKTPKLIKAEPHFEDVETRHYSIFTVNQNYFANGLLSGNRFTKPLKKGGNV